MPSAFDLTLFIAEYKKFVTLSPAYSIFGIEPKFRGRAVSICMSSTYAEKRHVQTGIGQ